jgi:hypothetical protein
MFRFFRLRTALNSVFRALKLTLSRNTLLQRTKDETDAHCKHQQIRYLGVIQLHWIVRHLDSISILKVLFDGRGRNPRQSLTFHYQVARLLAGWLDMSIARVTCALTNATLY